MSRFREKPKKTRARKVKRPAPHFPDDMTIGTARQIVSTEMRHDGVRCPVCTRRVKIDRRSLSGEMAECLVALHRYDKEHPGEFVKTAGKHGYFNELQIGRNNDAALLRHWRFVEPRPNEKGTLSAKGARGYWRITQIGRDFVDGRVKMPWGIFHFNQEFVAFDTARHIGIQEAMATPVDADANLSITFAGSERRPVL